MVEKAKGTVCNFCNYVAEKIRNICRTGILGKTLQIQGYIGRPKKCNNKEKEQWDRYVDHILSNYKGIRVWENALAGRIGEYLIRYRQLARFSQENNDGYLNVEYDSHYDMGNKALTHIMDRTIPAITRENSDKWNYILRRIPHIDWSHFGPMGRDDTRVYLYDDCMDLLKLNDEENRYCEKKLCEMGLDRPYVCFSSRDSRYLEKLTPWKDSSYHNYRDSSIENKSLMIDYLASEGIGSVRMGKNMAHRFVHNGSIDFSFDHYDDLMDIYLHQHAKFVVEDMNGLIEIPMTNNGNLVITNLTPLMDIFCCSEVKPRNGIYIFKKEYSHKLNRFLNIEEMFEAEAIARYDGRKYDQMEIEMIENTPEEILDATIEMNMRLDGKWVETDEERRLQDLFWKKIQQLPDGPGFDYLGVFVDRVGVCFLKKNKEILGID